MLHKGALTEIDKVVAGGHAFGRHLQQDAYTANLARKDQVTVEYLIMHTVRPAKILCIMGFMHYEG